MAPTKPKASQSNQRLKAVVRRLPPDLPPAVFWKTVEPWIHRENTADKQDTTESKENTVAWSDYKQGVVRKSGKDKDSVHSRAYITFRTPEALVAFHRGYDGWSFKDKTGNISQAVVEFAPYQRMPTAPSKPDPRQGTIDQDPDFLAFQTALTAPPDPADTPAEPVTVQDPRSTPLLEHLRAQKAAALATRKAAARKGKAALRGDEPLKGKESGKNGKKNGGGGGGGKEKKNGKGGGGKSKEPSRSGTPVPSNPPNKNASRVASGSGQSRNKGAQHSQAVGTRDPPGVVYPPGSVGAQQAAASAAKAQQAQLVRQQLQRQHQQQTVRSGGGGGGGAGGTPTESTSNKPQPMILKNTSRQTPQATNPPPSVPPSTVTPIQQPKPQAQTPKGPKADVAGQRRQVGAAIGAALNEGNAGAGGSKRGRGRGGGGRGGRGGGEQAGRGGRGRGRGGAGNPGGAAAS
ncbi:hypothetical protein JCM16303_003326 [Sporobolomyces ruberrimus]